MQPDRFIAYKITCAASGKCYIGITTGPLEIRWKKHQEAAIYGRKTKIAAAMRKHGLEAFAIEVVAEAGSRDDLLELERLLIAQENSRNRGYNMTHGGDGVPGLTHSAETRRKLSQALTGKKQRPETIAKRAAAHRGKKYPPRPAPWRAAISAAAKGRKLGPQPEATRRKISAKNAGAGNGMHGRSHDAAAKAKIAEANRAAGSEYLARLQPLFHSAAAAGLRSPQAVADWLNDQGVTTRNGAKWTASAVCYFRRRFRHAEQTVSTAT